MPSSFLIARARSRALKWSATITQRLLAPQDPTAPDVLDAHPLVREWFGRRLEEMNSDAWRAAHGRVYEHLRDTTHEGRTPTLEDLAPLYQAIPHGCRARRHQEALDDIYMERICRRGADGQIEFYARNQLGAFYSCLVAIAWFFEKPYETPAVTLTAASRSWVLSEAAFVLRAQGRFAEVLPAQRAALRMNEEAQDWNNAASSASNLSQAELLVGEVAAARATAEQSVAYADQSRNEFLIMSNRAVLADALHTAGRREEAERIFADVEERQRMLQPEYPLLYSLRGYKYGDLLLAKGEWATARDLASRTLEWVRRQHRLLDIALDMLAIGRAHLGLALEQVISQLPADPERENTRTAQTLLSEAVEGLRAAGQLVDVPFGLLARATFRRSVGDWDGAGRDLDEVQEIAEPEPMSLYACDIALERARLAFARIAAFAPLSGLIDDSPPKPAPPAAEESPKLAEEARANLSTSRELIENCGYHRRDEEPAELESVRDGRRCFADLPPRV